jgi:2-polyprenyl-6-methoxyphenol hydroxylase-like FAD-dependent oxidoreductase
LAAIEPGLVPLLDQVQSEEDTLHVRYGAMPASCWGDGRLVIIGDAAHAMSPQLGQGASLALLDAWTLADRLDSVGDVSVGIRHFVANREAHVRGCRRLSRVVTMLYQSTSPAARWSREHLVPALTRVRGVETVMLQALAGVPRHGQWRPAAEVVE